MILFILEYISNFRYVFTNFKDIKLEYTDFSNYSLNNNKYLIGIRPPYFFSYLCAKEI